MDNRVHGRKPTLAYIAQTFPALTQTFVYREVGELRNLGFRIITCAIWRPDVDKLSEESRHYLDGSTYIFPIKWGSFVSAHIRMLTRYPLRYLSTLFFIITRRNDSMHSWFRSFFHFLEAVSLAPALVENEVDHIHAHFTINAATIALVLSRLMKISFSFTAHNIFFTDRILLKEKVESAKFIASISNYSKQVLLQLLPSQGNAEKIHVVHCGLSAADFSPVEDENQAEFPNLVFIAQLEERKGAPYLVEACRLLADQNIAFTCNLIGGGEQRDQLQRLIEEYQIGDKVKLLGALPQEDVKEYLSSADVFILPCIIAENGDIDGIPVSLMEAMAMEIPVISTSVSGIPELIVDGEYGVLVEPEDAAALSQAIINLWNNPSMRKKIAANGRQKILADFNLHQTSAELGLLFSQYAGN